MFKQNLASALLLLSMGTAGAENAPRDPVAVLDALADRLYVVGETSGDVKKMIAAEAEAADEVRRYVASGATTGLLARENGKPAPLAIAASMGYPTVVAALLTSSVVRAHINDADEKRVTPWIAANFSMEQSLWSCKPAVFDNPFFFVSRLVILPYYLANPTPPYKKTRELLEQANAVSDLAEAKNAWLDNCASPSAETRRVVESSMDLQETVQQLGMADLAAHLIKLQNKSAEAPKKQ